MKKGTIDEIGNKEAQIKVLKKEVEELRSTVKDELEVGVRLTEKDFYAEIGEKVITEYDTKKVSKAIGDEKKFFDVVKVAKTKLNKYLSKEQMDKCSSSTDIQEVLYIRKIKKTD